MIVLWVASALTILLGVAHSALGERFIIARVMQQQQPHLFGSDAFTKRTLRFAWHVMTLFAFALAAVMAWMAVVGPVAFLAWMLAATFVLTAGLTLVMSKAQHLSWVVEVVIVGLLLAAL